MSSVIPLPHERGFFHCLEQGTHWLLSRNYLFSIEFLAIIDSKAYRNIRRMDLRKLSFGQTRDLINTVNAEYLEKEKARKANMGGEL